MFLATLFCLCAPLKSSSISIKITSCDFISQMEIGFLTGH